MELYRVIPRCQDRIGNFRHNSVVASSAVKSPETQSDELAISLRLKAARYLNGKRDDKGHAVAMTTAELAAKPSLAENGITKNRIEDIEQMRAPARPMELEKIADALRLPADWFAPAGDLPIAKLNQIERALNDLIDRLVAAQVIRASDGEPKRSSRPQAEEDH